MKSMFPQRFARTGLMSASLSLPLVLVCSCSRAPSLTFSSSELTLDSHGTHESTPIRLVLTNRSDHPVDAPDMRFSDDTDSDPFYVRESTERPCDYELSPNESCELYVVFRPPLGKDTKGKVFHTTLFAYAKGVESAQVALTGRIIEPASCLTASPASWQAKSEHIAKRAKFSVTNECTFPIENLTVTRVGLSEPPERKEILESTACNGTTLRPKETCTFRPIVSLDSEPPDCAGTVSGSYRLEGDTSDGKESVTIPVSVAFDVTPAPLVEAWRTESLDFGTLTTKDLATSTLLWLTFAPDDLAPWRTNPFELGHTLQVHEGPFVVTLLKDIPSAYSAAGISLPYEVRLRDDVSIGDAHGTLRLPGSCEREQFDIPVTAHVVSPPSGPLLTVDHLGLHFDQTRVNRSSPPTITVTNRGNADAESLTFTFGAGADSHFQLTSSTTCTTKLPAHESCKLAIAYHPDGTQDEFEHDTLTIGYQENSSVLVHLTGKFTIIP